MATRKNRIPAEPVANSGNGHDASSNPLGMNDQQFRSFMGLVNNQLTMRLDWFKSTLDPRRNIFHECGWGYDGADIDAWTYQRLYDREPIAARVVEVFPKETWQVQPMVYEEEDSDDVTEFEDAWDVVSDSLMGDSWFKQEEGSPVWGYARRADIQSGIGRYGVIFIGLDDGRPLDQPADYRTKEKEGNGKVTRKLTMLRVLPEPLAQIGELEEDPSNPRYMRPKYYNLNFADPNVQMYGPVSSDGRGTVGTKVHWTRVQHIADNLGSSELFGVPRLQVPMNCCLDIQKVRGGSAEMYWRGAMPGWALETHPQLGPDAVINPVAAKAAFESMFEGLQRFIGLPGMSAKSLAPQVVDPNPQIKAQIEAICIYLGIPIRIFMGSERGELASSQDDAAWNDRLRERQLYYVTPRIIIALVDRLIALGVLPIPRSSKGAVIVNRTRLIVNAAGEQQYVKDQIRKPLKVGYCVEWPDLESQSDQEKATVFATRMGAYAQFADTGAANLMDPMDMFTREAGYTEEEAQAIITNVNESKEERMGDMEGIEEGMEGVGGQGMGETMGDAGIGGGSEGATSAMGGAAGVAGKSGAMDKGNALRATVGGSTAIAALQTAYYAGEIPREAALSQATIVFGFSDEEANALFPEKKPEKLTPDEPIPPGLGQGPPGAKPNSKAAATNPFSKKSDTLPKKEEEAKT